MSEKPSHEALSKAQQYTYRTHPCEDGDGFVSKPVEWPSLSAFGATMYDALEEAQNLVAFCIDDCEQDGDAYPEPIHHREFSGKFVLRITQELHRELALEAAEHSQSLNQYIATQLLKRQHTT